MSFQWPFMLLGLLLVPLAVVGYVLAQGRRVRYAARFTNLDLLAGVVTASPGWRRHLPPALTLLALTALVIALARPEATLAVPREEATVMLASDSSGSMQATDVEPNRLVAAREAARAFSDGLPDAFRLGLVSFNERAEMLVAPTTDRPAVERALDALQARGGTAMGDALDRSLQEVGRPRQADGERPPATIVLLSDGKSTTGANDPVAVAREARRLGVTINTVALGTPGGTIELRDPSGFQRSLPVPPDTESLRQIARASGGRFFAAPDAEALDQVYESLGSRIGFERRRQEVTFGFAAAGLGLLAAGTVLGMAWFGRFP